MLCNAKLFVSLDSRQPTQERLNACLLQTGQNRMLTYRVVAEDVIRPNPDIAALDESSQCIVLADFTIEGACRHSLIWERDKTALPRAALSVLSQLAEATGLDLKLMIGWRHDSMGALRGRHRAIVRSLKRAGFDLHIEPNLGLATIRIEPSKLVESHEKRCNTDVGWCVVLGDRIRLKHFASDPFRRTIDFFCWNHRLQPSEAFLRGLKESECTIGYFIAGDDRRPSLHLISTAKMSGVIRRAIDTPPSQADD